VHFDKAALVTLSGYRKPGKTNGQTMSAVNLKELLDIIFKKSYLDSVIGPDNPKWKFGDSFMVSISLSLSLSLSLFLSLSLPSLVFTF